MSHKGKMDQIEKLTLKEYLVNYRTTKAELAFRCKIASRTLDSYLLGKRKPTQKNAEKIERETGGRVTVLIQRGTDDRSEKIPRSE